MDGIVIGIHGAAKRLIISEKAVWIFRMLDAKRDAIRFVSGDNKFNLIVPLPPPKHYFILPSVFIPPTFFHFILGTKYATTKRSEFWISKSKSWIQFVTYWVFEQSSIRFVILDGKFKNNWHFFFLAKQKKTLFSDETKTNEKMYKLNIFFLGNLYKIYIFLRKFKSQKKYKNKYIIY